MEKAALERYLADGLSLEAIGRRAGRAASTIGYWVSKHGLVAVHHERRVSRGGITRQRLEELVEAGMSSRAIAALTGPPSSVHRQ
jgi:IS30 family transposase